jgi:RNA polymerase sigma-54 factor
MNVNINQRLAITPQFIQSIKILEMGCYELKEYIEEFSLENPVIEIEKNYSEIDNQEKLERKLEWLESVDEENRVCNRLFREQEYVEPSYGENT